MPHETELKGIIAEIYGIIFDIKMRYMGKDNADIVRIAMDEIWANLIVGEGFNPSYARMMKGLLLYIRYLKFYDNKALIVVFNDIRKVKDQLECDLMIAGLNEICKKAKSGVTMSCMVKD